jgi:SAM-dependent methyltransferase
MSVLARSWLAGHRHLLTSYRLMHGIMSGVGLGVLSREHLHAISERAYAGIDTYQADDYNRGGLSPWEERAVESYFGACTRVLVAAAGGGREVLALRRRGLKVDGFEAHPALVAYANELLKREGHGDSIRPAPWDACPEYEDTYDGAIIGWGAYMHIRGRDRRVALLDQLRDRLETGSPLLLSFLGVERFSRWMRLAAAIGSALAVVTRRERVELGDWMEPDYKHYFTREQLRRELADGGFEMAEFSSGPLGSAVGIAVERAATQER